MTKQHLVFVLLSLVIFLGSCGNGEEEDRRRLAELTDSAELYASNDLYLQSTVCCSEGVALALKLNDTLALGKLEYRTAANFLQVENYDAANMHFVRAFKYLEHVETPEVKFALGKCCTRYGQYLCQIMEFDSAFEQLSLGNDAIVMAIRLGMNKQNEEALDSLYGVNLMYLAVSSYGKGNREIADGYVERYLATSYSKTLDGRLLYAYYMLEQDRYEDCIAKMDEVDASKEKEYTMPQRLTYLYKRALAYSLMKDYENATQTWREYERFRHMSQKDFSNHQLIFQGNVIERRLVEGEAETIKSENDVLHYVLYVALILILLLLVIIALLFRHQRHIVRVSTISSPVIKQELESKPVGRSIDSKPAQPVAESTEDMDRAAEKQEREESYRNTCINKFVHELITRKLYCNPNFRRENLINELHLRKSTFMSDFELVMGESFTTYLQRIRLEHAAEMLSQNNNLTIDSIALDSGFSGRSTFYRLFSEQYGVSPNEYRKM